MTAAIDFVQHPVRPQDVAITGGFVGRRYLANITGSIRKFDIDHHVKMLETPKHQDWWWIGEQPGKWLESAVLASASTGDASLGELTRTVLDRIVRAQSDDGYLGITDPSVRTPVKPLRGMDPYEQYFTFHGLLTAYEVFNDPSALEAAKGLADYYVKFIGEGGKPGFWPSPLRPPENLQTIICKQWTWVPPGTPQSATLYWQSEIAGHTAHYGWEGTLILDPVLRLYQLTGEARYLDFAKWIVASIDTWSGWNAFSRLDDVAQGKAGVHQLQPYVHAHTFHMNFLGFLRLYQITGDKTLLDKVAGAWDDIHRRQMYVTGGVSSGEHYKPDHDRPLTGEVVETCANMSWMQLTQQLLQLTGHSKYADVIERILFNHVFASQTIDGDSYRYHTPPNGHKPEKYFHGPDCCTSSGHRLVAMLPQFIYTHEGDAITINQYVASSATFQIADGKSVTVRQTTTYPETDAVEITMSCDAPARFAVMLRVPGWCDNASVTINNEPVSGLQGGGYVRLNRDWKSGDRIALRLPMQAKWIEHDHLEPVQSRMAIQRGPVVYAVDTVWWDVDGVPSPAEVDDALRIPAEGPAEIEEIPLSAPHLGPALRSTLTTTDGVTIRPMFVPFANVGCWYRASDRKPDIHSAAFSYAVWLRRYRA